MPEEFYDIFIEGTHSYVANGFLVHDSTREGTIPMAKETKDWMEHVEALFNANNGMTEWEEDFVLDVLEDPPEEFSPRQQATIQRMVKQYLGEEI